jgi:hypothetical protein
LNGRNNLPNPANVGYQSLRGGTGTVGGQPLQGAGVVGGAEQLGSQLRPNPASNFAGDIARINDPTAAPLPGTTQGAGNFGGAASLNTNVPPTFVPRRRQGNTDLATFLASSRTF